MLGRSARAGGRIDCPSGRACTTRTSSGTSATSRTAHRPSLLPSRCPAHSDTSPAADPASACPTSSCTFRTLSCTRLQVEDKPAERNFFGRGAGSYGQGQRPGNHHWQNRRGGSRREPFHRRRHVPRPEDNSLSPEAGPSSESDRPVGYANSSYFLLGQRPRRGEAEREAGLQCHAGGRRAQGETGFGRGENEQADQRPPGLHG